MGKIIYNGIDCGGGSGGGVDIEPNPSEAATDTLEKLGIDGTVYDFEGTTYTAGTNIQINENVISATDTTYSAFQGTDGTEAGSSGLVPAPAATDTNKYLKSDGTWATVSGGGSGNVDNVYVNGTSVLDSNHIAQITSYKEITQSQYDALPDDKLTDNILYCIKDTGVVEGEKFAPIIYSLEEREVGVWIDGKPLYQKSFDRTSLLLTDNTWNYDILGTSNISIKKFDGYFILEGRNIFPYSYIRSTTEFFTAYTNNNNSDIRLRPNMNAGVNIYAGIVAVWYTKNTDVAGSGAWTTTGVPAVHYSTNEQVIGTWIDGKPLYQKTVEFNSPISGSTANLSLGIANVDKIFLCADASSVNNICPLPYITGTNAGNNIGGFFEVTPSDTSFAIRIGSAMVGTINSAIITVKYTKTTD